MLVALRSMLPMQRRFLLVLILRMIRLIRSIRMHRWCSVNHHWIVWRILLSGGSLIPYGSFLDDFLWGYVLSHLLLRGLCTAILVFVDELILFLWRPSLLWAYHRSLRFFLLYIGKQLLRLFRLFLIHIKLVNARSFRRHFYRSIALLIEGFRLLRQILLLVKLL